MPTLTKTTVGLNLLRDSNSGAANDTITYVSLGTGTTAPSAGDVKLVAEVFRKKVTSYANGTTGEILVSMYLAPGDANGFDIEIHAYQYFTRCTVLVSMYLAPGDANGFDIEEVGFWGGNASSTPNSGVLIGRGLWSHNPKVSTESIQFQLDWIYS